MVVGSNRMGIPFGRHHERASLFHILRMRFLEPPAIGAVADVRRSAFEYPGGECFWAQAPLLPGRLTAIRVALIVAVWGHFPAGAPSPK